MSEQPYRMASQRRVVPQVWKKLGSTILLATLVLQMLLPVATVSAADETLRPTLVSASVNHNTLRINYSEALDTTSVPNPANFKVIVQPETTPRTVLSVDIPGGQWVVVLTLAERVSSTDNVSIQYTPGVNRIKDLAGNQALAATMSVFNGTDESAPQFVTASVNRDKLELEYDEPLATTPLPAASDFIISVYNYNTGEWVVRPISAVAISGSTVSLTLNPRMFGGEYVYVEYTPGTNPIKDLDNNKAVSLSANVHNGTDASTPGFVAATVNRDQLKLIYDETLAATPLPAASDFVVSVYDGTTGDYVPRSVSGVAISGFTVVLTLSSRVFGSESVYVEYTPGTNPLKDLDNNLANAEYRQVHNGTDASTPGFVAATVNRDQLKLIYDETLAATPLPAASDFVVSVYDGTTGDYVPRSVSGVAISGSTVVLTLSSRVFGSESVYVEYTPGTNPIKDLDNNKAGYVSRSAHNGTDESTPDFIRGTVNGTKLELEYNETLAATPLPAASDFVVSVYDGTTGDSAQRSVSGVAISGSTVVLTLSSRVFGIDGVEVEYIPGTNPIKDLDNNLAAGIGTTNVHNGTDVSTPTFVGATVNGNRLRINYDEQLRGSPAPSVSDFAVSVYDNNSRYAARIMLGRIAA